MKYLNIKTTDELEVYLKQVELDYRNLQDTATPTQPGYKRTNKLIKGNPNPKQLRRTIARIKTIINSRRKSINYFERHG